MRPASQGRSWSGEAFLRPGQLTYRGAVATTGRHAHHAVQVLVSSDPVTLADATGQTATAAAAVIPANAGHAITGRSELAVMIYLDPAGATGRRLNRHDGGVHEWISAGEHLVGTVERPITDMTSRLTDGVRGPAAAPPGHPAVARAVADIEQRLVGGPVPPA